MAENLIVRIAAGVGSIQLNRPEVHNAFDERLITDLTDVLRRLEADPEVRVVQLAAGGPTFCAGADLDWMRRSAEYDHEDNVRDALRLATLMRTLDELGKPTLARVQGPAFGGGVGLISCCDIAVAVDSALFCLSEVRLGLVPAIIAPFVLRAIGPRAARRYFLSAERFAASTAKRLGLVHETVPADALENTVDGIVAQLLAGGPAAQARSKALIRHVAGRDIDGALLQHTAEQIALARASPEGREGLAAFFARRDPRWRDV